MSWANHDAEVEAQTREFLQPIPVPLALIEGIRRRALIRTSVTKYCESPIEADLATHLIERFGFISDLRFSFCRQADIASFQDRQLLLIPQFRWRRYRIDFALMFEAKVPYVFIECDGREFHSSPTQIANDRRKDAEAASMGIPMLRFSGAELYRWDDTIAGRVWAAVIEQVSR